MYRTVAPLEPTGAVDPVPDWQTFKLPHLRAWRHYVGASLSELRDYCEVSIGLVHAVEYDRSRMRGRFVNQIAAALGIPTSLLVASAPTDPKAEARARKAAMAFAVWKLRRRMGVAS